MHTMPLSIILFINKMGNCLLCKLQMMPSNPNNRCVQTMAGHHRHSTKTRNENKRKDYKKSVGDQSRSLSNRVTNDDGSIHNSATSFNKSFKEIFHNSNENVEKVMDRNNNRHASNSSSKNTDLSLFNSSLLRAGSQRLTSIPKRTNLKRNRQLNNKHVFCDSSLETETNSNDSTHCETSQKSFCRTPKHKDTHLFHISRIPPPSPVPYRRRVEMAEFQYRMADRQEEPTIEYTFYVTDKEICRKPLIDNRVNSIVASCHCFLKIHGRPTNSNYAEQQNKKVFYKGNPVIPVTLKSYNMSSLRKCIGRLDIQFPYFHVKAFLNS